MQNLICKFLADFNNKALTLRLIAIFEKLWKNDFFRLYHNVQAPRTVLSVELKYY